MTDLETQNFEESVELWVLEALSSNVKTFNQLLSFLPGVYPSIVLRSLKRLASKQIISPNILPSLIKPANSQLEKPISFGHQIPLPVPHPLDYDWRFSDTAVKDLLNKCKQLTHDHGTLILIGTPSLLRMGLEQSYPRKLILLEASQTITASLSQTVSKSQVVQCDVMRDTLPQLSAEAVVLDPPWYPEHIHSFLWAACQLCQLGGYILISLPPLGTRPDMKQEWLNTLDWTKQMGLTLDCLEESALPYITPNFELNALKAEGLETISREWRRGNLAVFKRNHSNLVPRPQVPRNNEKWIEKVLSGVRVRIRQPNLVKFLDPSLISIVPGDVLKSVSRRDQRRRLADVWTSGNRIFACQGRGVFLLILKALVEGQSPHQTVALGLKRPLNYDEQKLVSKATHQIINLIKIEQQENSFFEEQQNNLRFFQYING